MQKKWTLKCSIVFVVCILLSTTFLQVHPVSADNGNDSSSKPIIDIIGDFLAGGPPGSGDFGIWPYKPHGPGGALLTVPAVIEIGYNESVNFSLGFWDFFEGTFRTIKLQGIASSKQTFFEVSHYPGGSNIDNKWLVNFNPSQLDWPKNKNGTKGATNVTITLNSPPIGSDAIQSGILTIELINVQAYADLRYVPGRNKKTGEELPWYATFYSNPIWFITAVTGGWGKYSGTMNEGKLSIDVLVKVKQYHEVIMEVIDIISLSPDQVKSVPIKITNLGNYKDTIGFRIVSENEGILLSSPINITLRPGESKNTIIGIGADPKIWDSGTIHKVDIQVFSLDNINKTLFSRTLLVETKGVYVSEGNFAGFFTPLIVFLLIIIYYITRRKRKRDRIAKKPDKPWKIPEEKKYLEELKKKDKKKYKITEKQMKEEYKSALLWYKHYIATHRKKQQTDVNIVTERIKPLFGRIKEIIFASAGFIRDKLKSVKIENSKKNTTNHKRERKNKKKLTALWKKSEENNSEKKSVEDNKNKKKSVKQFKKSSSQKSLKNKNIPSKKQQVMRKIEKEQKKQQRRWGETT